MEITLAIPDSVLQAAVEVVLREKFSVPVTLNDPLFNTRQAAAYMGVTPEHIRNLIAEGKLKSEDAGTNDYRLRLSELDAYLKRHQRKNR